MSPISGATGPNNRADPSLTAARRNRNMPDGSITYDLEEFREEYGDPIGQLFTFEVTYNATTYTYADIVPEVEGGRVVFDLSEDDLVSASRHH